MTSSEMIALLRKALRWEVVKDVKQAGFDERDVEFYNEVDRIIHSRFPWFDEKLVDDEADQHYKSLGIEPFNAMRAWMGPEQYIGFLRGNVIKYIARYEKKGGIDDLRKCNNYLKSLISELSTLDKETSGV